ncbi:hypothetical protein N7501_000112 [Penicillium viridicatum]|nr:hypothetical protein N7501_000112 [Penicillium viridicatum]
MAASGTSFAQILLTIMGLNTPTNNGFGVHFWATLPPQMRYFYPEGLRHLDTGIVPDSLRRIALVSTIKGLLSREA